MKISPGVTLVDVLHLTNETIKVLLGLRTPPALEAWETSNGYQVPIDGDIPLNPGIECLVRFSGSSLQGVDLCVIDVPQVDPSDPEGGCWAVIEVVSRVPSYFALASALAVAIGRICKSPIVDEVRFWSQSRITTADDLASGSRVVSFGEEFDQACTLYYSGLPKGQCRGQRESR